MNKNIIKKALEEAQHELTTLNNLIVTDNSESRVVWTTDVSSVLKSIEQALIGENTSSTTTQLKNKTSPPLIIESVEETGTKWLISFTGPNPNDGDAIELPKEQCFWLLDKIMNIAPNLFCNAKEKYLSSK